MKYIDIYNNKFIVLTWGRTGSILLWKNIERNFRQNPKYQTNDFDSLVSIKAIKNFNDLEVTDLTTILHSHVFFSRQNLVDYQIIFSIRKDYVEQILSMYLTQKFNKFHLLTKENYSVQIEPFEFQDWSWLQGTCRTWVKWHQYYSDSIDKNDLVVVYEKFVMNLGPDQLQKKIYPDKQKYIKNYKQVKDFIESNTVDDKNLLDKFLNHSNKFDIYSFIT